VRENALEGEGKSGPCNNKQERTIYAPPALAFVAHAEALPGQQGVLIDDQWQGVLIDRQVRLRFSKESEMKTFYGWLKEQRERDDPVGDVARDAMVDAGFPRWNKPFSAYSSHLRACQASPEAMRALREAWQEYKRDYPLARQ
jgi:uncharacterized protein YozE (UPF0346 family)